MMPNPIFKLDIYFIIIISFFLGGGAESHDRALVGLEFVV